MDENDYLKQPCLELNSAKTEKSKNTLLRSRCVWLLIRMFLLQGPPGIQGSPGIGGASGAEGEVGASGVQGGTGETGERGKSGKQGVKGSTGDSGPNGLAGKQGQKGAMVSFCSYLICFMHVPN